jgi:hypothetical protein
LDATFDPLTMGYLNFKDILLLTNGNTIILCCPLFNSDLVVGCGQG